MLLIMLKIVDGHDGSSVRNFSDLLDHFLVVVLPRVEHFTLVAKDMVSEHISICLVKDVLRYTAVVIVKVDHYCVIIVTEYRCDSFDS